MTTRIRPSDGRVSGRGHINLNAKGFKLGERVLFDGFSGWTAGTIDRWTSQDGNTALIGVEAVCVTKIKARIPAGVDEAALVAALREAEQEHGRVVATAREALEARRRTVLGEHGIAC